MVIEGVIIDIPTNTIPAPNPTCCKLEKVGRSKKSYRTPNNIVKPSPETAIPTINRVNRDFRLGVETLSLIASIGLTCEAFLAGSKDDKIVTVTPIINPVIAASVVNTKGPSGRPNSKYCNPSFTATAKPIPNPIPNPEPMTDMNNASEITSLYICRFDVPRALSRDNSFVLCNNNILKVF